MWSEEEMREIEPERPAEQNGNGAAAGGLRRTIAAQNLTRARLYAHQLTRGVTPAVVYRPTPSAGQAGTPRSQDAAAAGRTTATHGNFLDASYARIVAHPKWARRLEKAHTAKSQARPHGVEEEVHAWRELDTASSSDALLMNIFCYPRVLAEPHLPALLGVERGLIPEFGLRAQAPLANEHVDRTEIDMRLGSLLVEAKLTEADFQLAPIRLLERYTDFDTVFDRSALHVSRAGVRSYQLIRGVLAAHAARGAFCVLCDARRPDLIEAWFNILLAVRSIELRMQLRLHTWQEIAGTVPRALRQFLSEKYGIEAAKR